MFRHFCVIFRSLHTACVFLNRDVYLLVYAKNSVVKILKLCQNTYIQCLSPCIAGYGTYTRWFKYDRDYLCVNKSQFVPVIFEPPCICCLFMSYLLAKTYELVVAM
jgi:hypothetical protein